MYILSCAAVDPSEDGVNSWDTDDTERVAVPKPLTMLDLNEDCLNQIFESKYVSAMDLVSVTKSCSKLKRISTQIFTKKYNMCNFNDAGVKNLVMAENLLETFGSLISGLCINFAPYGFDGSKIVDAILRFCENLNSLSMASYEIPDTRDDITKITLLFGKVEVLHINDVKIEWPDGCVVDDFVTPNAYVMDIFENCNSLIDLKIENCPTLELVAFGNKFSQLEHIYYAYGGNDVGTGFLDDGYIPAFIMRHRKLKSLRLTEQMRNVQVLCMIPVYCKELENLEFRTETNSDDRFFTFWLASLAQLDRLRELKIVWRGQRVTDMLKEFHRSKSLNVLHLESVKGGLDLLQSLAGIKTLRCVKLVDVELHPFGILTHITGLIEHKTGEIESSFDISKLVDGLPNLRKLKIHCKNYSLTESEYVRLADAVECRVGTDRYLQVDCNTTGDFTNSLRRSVQFKTFVQ
ncbi:hypothetical protein HA402_011193 [Bradysia odoriphaga]|nr:hypothetical protein HA402_011193 [Bradysia odoriphaga]